MDYELDLPIADPHEQRVPCVLLLDVSSSMIGEPIRQLNDALQLFKQDLISDALASKRAEVAVITFDSQPTLIQDFTRVSGLHLPPLEARGSTAMGEAILMGLEEIEIRKELYRSQGVQYTRPWIFLLTDGAPSNGSAFEVAVQQAADAFRQNKVLIFGIGVGAANMENLQRVSGDLTFKLNPSFSFADFFRFVSASLRSASASKPGEQLRLNPGEILIKM